MADEAQKPEATALSDAIDRKFSALERLLGQIERHGFATVATVVLTWLFIIPMRDGHLQFLQNTSKSIESIDETNRKTGAAIQQTGDALEKTADAAIAIQSAVELTGLTSAEHFKTSKDTKAIAETTAEDVKAIKDAVVPK